MTSAPVLVHFDPEKPVGLSCEVSPYGVRALFAHREADGQEPPIAFAEQNNCQLNKEALSLVYGMEMFHQYLEGIPFEAYRDHKPLH